MSSLVKICGVTDPAALAAALTAGADMVGFVSFPPSPRHLALDEAAALAAAARGRARRVLLLVDPSDAELDAAVAAIAPDLLQLHGHETPERLAAVRRRTGLPVAKAVGIAGPDDLAAVAAFRAVADRILLDAKAPAGATRPGGNGAAFDWTLLRGAELGPGAMLSGGLDPGNVAAAIAATGLRAVDVSSGVESRPGVKDPAKIAAFVAASRAAFAALDDTRQVA
ncbi:MAG: phosphoribosylanthranilate isomerase [Methylobacteriaceae bacterium]|nr:phosphoribosylanthranilate isomerase [Methylobacteriaceae bacterium]